MANEEPFKKVVIHISGLGIHVSVDEVKEFAEQYTEVYNIRMGYRRKTKVRRDYFIVTLKARMTTLGQIIKNAKFRGKSLNVSLISMKPI